MTKFQQGCAAFALAVLAGCARQDLFQAPAKRAPQGHLQPPESLTTLTLVTRIPYDSIQKLIARETPAVTELQGSGHAACAQVPNIDPGGIESHEHCTDVPYCDISLRRQVCGTRRQCVRLPDTVRPPRIGTREQCADYHWNATFSPDGAPVVARAGDAIHLELPARIAGKAGLNGDLAKLLSLSGKNFEARLKPGADVRFSLGTDWCPIVNATPTNEWVTSASVEAVGKNCVGIDLGPLGHPEVCAGPVNIGLTDAANGAIGPQRDKLSALAQSAFDCQALRRNMSAQWHALAVPLPVDSSGGPSLYLNITPKGFAFSGLRVEDDAARLALKVWATTRIEPTPAEPVAIELPPVSPFDSHASRLSVSLSATVPYPVIVATLGGTVRGKSFSSNNVRVRVEDVTAYTSTEGLAIGIKIDANLPGRLFDTRGWVYLVGKPQLAASGSALEIKDLKYATVLDNQAWKLLVGVFDSLILSELRTHSTIDLKESITHSAQELAAKINAADVKSVKIAAQIPTAWLEDFSMADDALNVAVSANMDFSIEITPDLLTQ
jgi:hypothetical protein